MAENKELKAALAQIDKSFVSYSTQEQISLDNPVLDGIFHGGLPLGSIIQLAAQSGVGKSTLVLQICKVLCSKGYNVAYIDVENGLNDNMLNTTGVLKYKDNFDTSIGGLFHAYTENDCNEVNLLVQQVCKANTADIIVIDSLGALDSGIYNIGGGDANNPKVGADTKSIKIIMKTINGLRKNKDKTFIVINHLAQEIGSYIPKENPTGGRAVVYIPDITLHLKASAGSAGTLKNEAGQRVGQKVTAIAEKSRWGSGKESIPFWIRFGHGIAMIPTLADILNSNIKTTDIEGREVPVLHVTPGSGNNILHLPSGDITFRGSDPLKHFYPLVAEHYDECLSLISAKAFEVNIIEDNWMKTEQSIANETKINIDLPAGFENVKIISANKERAYINKGIDSTGQEYGIFFDIENGWLTLEYDSGKGQTKPKPTYKDYEKFTEILEKYLKSL